MTDFVLKAGTTVKHGTSSMHLRSILENGLIPGHGRHELREISEATPRNEAVYVGDLSAYFGAYTAHTAFFKEYALAMPDITELAKEMFAMKSDPTKLELGNVCDSIPIVLEIKLGEDVRLIGDEDFMGLDSMSNNDEEVWNRWRSGGIPQTIPASWIKSFEYPRLITTADLTNDGRRAMLEKDVERMFWACKSVTEKFPQSATHVPKLVQRFSQSSAFNQKEVDRFFELRPISLTHNRFCNQICQNAYFNQFSQEHGFPAFETSV